MNRPTLCVLLAFLLGPATAEAAWPWSKPRPLHPSEQALLDGWYRNYLGRPIDAAALTVWGAKLTQTSDPALVQAQLLGSGEYYQRNGATPADFIRALYRDVDGNPNPSEAQVRTWLDKLREAERREVLAQRFLNLHPPGYWDRSRFERKTGITVDSIWKDILSIKP